eukprot:Rhum_TRINITY_DN11516_c0_g1::Rhum_TRINITY_DN11516_c0_g1_i1::g.45129::m.45129
MEDLFVQAEGDYGWAVSPAPRCPWHPFPPPRPLRLRLWQPHARRTLPLQRSRLRRQQQRADLLPVRRVLVRPDPHHLPVPRLPQQDRRRLRVLLHVADDEAPRDLPLLLRRRVPVAPGKELVPHGRVRAEARRHGLPVVARHRHHDRQRELHLPRREEPAQEHAVRRQLLVAALERDGRRRLRPGHPRGEPLQAVPEVRVHVEVRPDRDVLLEALRREGVQGLQGKRHVRDRDAGAAGAAVAAVVAAEPGPTTRAACLPVAQRLVPPLLEQEPSLLRRAPVERLPPVHQVVPLALRRRHVHPRLPVRRDGDVAGGRRPGGGGGGGVARTEGLTDLLPELVADAGDEDVVRAPDGDGVAVEELPGCDELGGPGAAYGDELVLERHLDGGELTRLRHDSVLRHELLPEAHVVRCVEGGSFGGRGRLAVETHGFLVVAGLEDRHAGNGRHFSSFFFFVGFFLCVRKKGGGGGEDEGEVVQTPPFFFRSCAGLSMKYRYCSF